MSKLLCISFVGNCNNSISLASIKNRDKNVSFHFIRKTPLNFFRDIITGACQAIKSDIVIINYVTLFLIFFPLLKLSRCDILFIPHEGEPLFPKNITVTHSLLRRFLSIPSLTRLCIFLADETYFLSGLQANFFEGNIKNIFRLGVDSSQLVSLENKENIVFFPNRKGEVIKGYDLLDMSKEYLANQGLEELSFVQMCELYKRCKIVVIPSFVETYSFCMVEAMLANCIVVTSKEVGLAFDLLNEYGFDTLVSYGIHVLDSPFNIDAYTKDLVEKNCPPANTFKLADDLGLDGQMSNEFLSKLSGRL